MTDEKKNNPHSQYNATSSPDPAQILEQAEQKAKDIPFPDLDTMSREEIQQRFHELHVKQIEAELENEQLLSQLEEKDDHAALLRIVTENMLDMVALTDMEGNFIFTGKAHEILGYEPGFLIGKNVMDFVHPEDLPRILKELNDFVASVQPRKVEYRYRCQDGSYLWLETVGNFIKDENGVPQKIIFNSRDITERKRTKHKLRESEEKYRFITEQMNDVVWTSDLEMRVTYISPSDERILGFTPEEREKHTLVDMLTPASQEKAMEAISKEYALEETGQVDFSRSVTVELEYRHKDGSTRWLETLATKIRDDKGLLIGFHGVSRDITDRKQLEETRRQSDERFRIAQDMSPDGFTILRPVRDTQNRVIDFTWVYENDSIARLNGTDPQKVVGQRLLELFPGHRDTQFMKAYQQVAESGKSITFEEGYSGESMQKQAWFRIVVVPMAENIAILAQDITERKQAEQALAESETRFKALHNASFGGIAIHDQGIILECNQGLSEMTGYQYSELIGMDGLLLIAERSREAVMNNIRIGYEKPYEAFGLRKNGEEFPLQLEARNVPYKGKQVRTVEFRDITERKQAEEERERLITAIEQGDEIVIITDNDGLIQYVNPAFERATGYSREEVRGQNPRIFKSGKQGEAFYREMWDTLTSGNTFHGRMINKRKDGSLYTEDATISPIRDAAGNIVNYVAVKRDVTAHIQLETQLLQAQKMESVGRLAGGVAHDYNNMLSVILGYTEMAMEQVDPKDQLYADLKEVYNAGKRSRDITAQLLAFARKQIISPVVMDLNETVDGMLKMLRRLIGEDIDFAWEPAARLWPVNMDLSQLDQILANLCVNARDAISGVGKITIETENITLDESYCAEHAGFIPGDFVMLAVSDNGCGMDKETMEQIFEPFFTTKEVGKGTGLGLPMIYGIVKQNNGFINVYSEPGNGTTFRIYLPRHTIETDEAITEVTHEKVVFGQGETLLLVEDEPAIIKMCQTMLEKLGYKVLIAHAPDEAVNLASEHSGIIHLLMSDVVMPGMNGRDLADKLRAIRPGIRVLFMSGYTANAIAHHGVLDTGVHFIQKPFSMKKLSVKVHEALEGGKSS